MHELEEKKNQQQQQHWSHTNQDVGNDYLWIILLQGSDCHTIDTYSLGKSPGLGLFTSKIIKNVSLSQDEWQESKLVFALVIYT